MVPHATSLPLLEKFLELKLPSRYNLDAIAKPSNLGICPEVGDMSAEELYFWVESIKSPFSSI